MNIKIILEDHIKWLSDKSKGERADLSHLNLSDSYFRDSNLSYSNLSHSNLSNSNLSYSDLSNSNLSNSNLRNSNLSYSNLSYSNLRNSDLSNSDLINSDLINSDLNWCVGNNKEIKTIQTGTWIITYTKDSMAIGCEQHTIKNWMSFSNSIISNMHKDALNFWDFWKPILKLIFDKEIIEY